MSGPTPALRWVGYFDGVEDALVRSVKRSLSNLVPQGPLFAALLLASLSSPALAQQTCESVFSIFSTRGVPLIAMDSRYRGEEHGLYVDPVTKVPWKVKYFTATELRSFELIPKGKLLWTSAGKKAESEFDAESMSFESSLVVIDRDHRIFALPFEERGRFHHSSLSAGQEVVFAGTMALSGGRIRELSDASGHYKPSVDQTLRVLKEFQRMGLDLSSMKLSGRIASVLGNTPVMTPKEVAAFLQD